jgi:hypothetical protein
LREKGVNQQQRIEHTFLSPFGGSLGFNLVKQMRPKFVGNHSSKSSAKALQVQDTGEETLSERRKSSVSTLGALGHNHGFFQFKNIERD